MSAPQVDAVAHNGRIVAHAISEHVENAGVHSGDATIIHPPQDLTEKTMHGVFRIAGKVAKALQINGCVANRSQPQPAGHRAHPES